MWLLLIVFCPIRSRTVVYSAVYKVQRQQSCWSIFQAVNNR